MHYRESKSIRKGHYNRTRHDRTLYKKGRLAKTRRTQQGRRSRNIFQSIDKITKDSRRARGIQVNGVREVSDMDIIIRD